MMKKKLTKTKYEKQILVVTVVFCSVAFQSFFDSLKLRFICQSQPKGSLLPFERGRLQFRATSARGPWPFTCGGSLSNDDDDSSKNVTKKVN